MSDGSLIPPMNWGVCARRRIINRASTGKNWEAGSWSAAGTGYPANRASGGGDGGQSVVLGVWDARLAAQSAQLAVRTSEGRYGPGAHVAS